MNKMVESSSNKVGSNDVKIEHISFKKRALKKLGQVGLGLFSAALVIRSTGFPAGAVDTVDTAKDVVGSEGGKEALNQALKVARSKPAMSIAVGITCIACILATGVAASPSMCVTCGILIARLTELVVNNTISHIYFDN